MSTEGIYEELQYRVEEDGICILKYLGENALVVIPDHIDGIPVKKVGDYALSGLEFLREVEIGANVTSIGRHCFYDSRKLRHVELTDRVRDMGDGAFKNCESLASIVLRSMEERDSCIRAILEECWQEIQVRVIYDDQETYLIFPEYEIEYFENYSTRPHLFYTEVYGSGQAYRQCLQGTKISYRDYDQLLEKSSRDDRGPVTAGIAMNRLKYPMNLSDERREACRKHLQGHAAEAIRWCLEQDMSESISDLIRFGVFTEENLPECIEVAEEAAEPAMVAALLGESMKYQKPKRSVGRRYEL